MTMVLDSDYTISSVRVVRPETEVRSVRSTHLSGGGCSGSGASAGGGASRFYTSSLGGASSSGVAAASGSSYSKSVTSTTRTIGGGGGSSMGGVSLGGVSGGFKSGAAMYGGSAASSGEYYVKTCGGSNRTAQALSAGLGAKIEDRAGSTSPGVSTARNRMLSDASQRLHEETATIVTKVIREDTSGMEARLRELGTITADLQGALKTILDQTSNDQGTLRNQIEAFSGDTTMIKESLYELNTQLTAIRTEVQSITQEVRVCDERIVTIDNSIEAKISALRQEMGDRDVIIGQIREELSNRDLVLADQAKQLRELEECRHSLFHAEEAIRDREDQIQQLTESVTTLTQRCEQWETQTTSHTEVITTLERDLDTERQGRLAGEQEISSLHTALAELEDALGQERSKANERDREMYELHQTITTLETTITEERGRFEGSGREINQLQENLMRLEAQLEEERRAKDDRDKEIVNITRQIEVLMREKQQMESESVHLKQQYQSDLDALTQQLERLTQERFELEEGGKRERRKSSQLQESMTNLRRLLEEEQRKSEEKERKIQGFDRVIKETREMFEMKQSEFEMLKEEIVHYKNLVATKEKELSNLTVVFNQNMNENKNEVGTLRQEIKQFKCSLQEAEFKLREYRDNEVLLRAVETTSSTHTDRSAAAGYQSHTMTQSSSHGMNTSTAITSKTASIRSGSPACRSPSPTLGYCQTHKSIVSLDSRASVGNCGTSCGGNNHGILNVRYSDPCKKLYPTKESALQETSREKIKGTRLCSVLALVGVGAGIKSLSHLVITTLERDLDTERQGRLAGEQEISSLHTALAELEDALGQERSKANERDREMYELHQTITTLETTITEERGRFEGSGREINQLQENLMRLEAQLEDERRAKDDRDKEIVNITRQIEVLMREKQQMESESVHLKQQYQSDLDALTQQLERLTQERFELEEGGKRERRKSSQLQESMTNLRRLLEEEQRKSEEKERKIQGFDRVIKETREMFEMKQSEFEMLKEEIVHYKNLVATKEKELSNLTVVFNQNMNENKNEVGTLRQEIKQFKCSLQEAEFKLREYRDNEVLLRAVETTSSTHTDRSAAAGYQSHTMKSHGMNTSTAITSKTASIRSGSPACRSPSPTLGYCQTHKSIVSLDSRASVGNCGTSCGGNNHGILNVRYSDPCKKLYPTKESALQQLFILVFARHGILSVFLEISTGNKTHQLIIFIHNRHHLIYSLPFLLACRILLASERDVPCLAVTNLSRGVMTWCKDNTGP
eukprot:sb/3461147/